MYLNFFHETVTSHNLETEATILLTSFSCFIARENTLVDQSNRTYYPNYFIITGISTYHLNVIKNQHMKEHIPARWCISKSSKREKYRRLYNENYIDIACNNKRHGTT